MSEIVDLDALAPEPIIIKFAGQTYELVQPSTGDVFKISKLSQDLSKADDEEQAAELARQLEEKIRSILPGFPQDKSIGLKQLMKLVQIVADMVIPEDAKELAKRGITMGSDDPKAPASPPSA